MPARLVQLSVAEGRCGAAGAELAVLEAMKMEHVLLAPHAGRVALAGRGRWLVAQGQPLLVLEAVDDAADVAVQGSAAQDPDHIRADLQRVIDRHAFTLDAARPEPSPNATRKAAAPRENIADLCDDGSFIEYGAWPSPRRRRRRSKEDLIANTPADGMVTGIGGINGALFGEEKSAPWSCPTTPPCSPAPRARATTPRPTACSASRWPNSGAAGGAVCRGRRRPAGRHRHARGGGACMCTPSPATPRCRARCRWSASPPGAALPATPRCWAAAT